MTSVKNLTNEQREAITKLFDDTNNMLNDKLIEITGSEADIVCTIHLDHGDGEKCGGAFVTTNTGNVFDTYVILNQGMISVRRIMETMHDEASGMTHH